MKEADEVIVLYKGRVLGKGSFTELQRKGILNTTVDPLYKGILKDNKETNINLVGEDEEESSDVTDSCGRMTPPCSDAKGLQISQEDRTIGVVSSKLYWEYFRSGMHTLVILAMICLCLVTQGSSLQESMT